MSEPRTVGEKVDRDGVCLALMLIADLAQVVGRIPAGEWDYRFASDPRWRICLNGGPHETWEPQDAAPIPRFHVYAEYDQFPVGIFNAAGGSMLAGAEDELIAALKTEIQFVPAQRTDGSA